MLTALYIAAGIIIATVLLSLFFVRRTPEEQLRCDVEQIAAFWGDEEAAAYRAAKEAKVLAREGSATP